MLKVRQQLKLAVFGFILILFVTGGVLAQGAASKTRSAINPSELFNAIWEDSDNVSSYQADITLVRQHPDFLKKILPPLDNPSYVTLKGVVNFSRTPRIFHVYFVESEKGGYYYDFNSTDGYMFHLPGRYRTMAAMKGIVPAFSRDSEQEVRKFGPVLPFSCPVEYRAGLYDFSTALPLNLLVPFPFKSSDPSQKLTYRRDVNLAGKLTHLIEVESPRFGDSLIYADSGKEHYIIRVDRLDERGTPYASMYYSDFRDFKKGGRLPQKMVLTVDGQPIFEATLKNIRVNETDSIVGLPRPAVTNAVQPSPTDAPAAAPVAPPENRRNPIITLLGILLGIFAAGFLAILGYQVSTFSKTRKPLKHEVIIVEDRRAEKKISSLFASLGIPVTQYSSELLSEERKKLRNRSSDLARVLVIGPGMSKSIKGDSHLIKLFVNQGGRVMIFRHSTEQAADLPVPVTLTPFSPRVSGSDMWLETRWEAILKSTRPETIRNKKKIPSFAPMEVITQVGNPGISLDPVISGDNDDVDVRGAAIACLKEGAGEYLLLQYRFEESIGGDRYEAGIAEAMIRDLITHMFGEETHFQLLPPFLRMLLGKENETGAIK